MNTIKTEIPLNFENRFLRICTSKSPTGSILKTTATVSVKKSPFVMSHIMFEDFYKVLDAEPCARYSKKKGETQHNNILKGLDSLIEEIREFYSNKVEPLKTEG